MIGLVAAAALGYGYGLCTLRRRGGRWPAGRTAAALTGLAALAVALLPPVASHDDRFPGHVLQHLLLGMLAPPLLALSAPATLALRALPRPAARQLARALHRLRHLTNVWTAAALSVAGPVALYRTPVYALTGRYPWLHGLVHVHLLLAGCLLAWALLGPDPVPRSAVPVRVVAVVLVAAAHDTVSKLVYAHGLPGVSDDPAGVRLGAQLMYYGADLLDVALCLVLLAGWYHRGTRRRAAVAPGGGAAGSVIGRAG